jgi:xanthine dehydrogenase D subunit
VTTRASAPAAPTRTGAPVEVDRPATTGGRVGDSAARPDGTLKVTGEFAYSSDLWADRMLWGATARSPHPRARIRGIDITGALRLPGVHAVLTSDDVPGSKVYGLEFADQPVLAIDEVRHHGEPVAVVAADHPDTARQAAALIEVDWEVLPPVTDPAAALRSDAARVHPTGNVVRHVKVRHGDVAAARADVVVRGEYRVGMQDQAFLGPESGLAVPAEDGGVDLFVATQWLHADQRQVAACLGLPVDKVRITLAGVGGAFGAREDLSMQVHACLLAMHTGRPVKIVYGRQESFFGHVHRHPARLSYEHGATRDGRIVYVKAEILLDGGAYASTSAAVAGNAATLGVGPYDVPNVSVDAWAMYTNNPPCGAMRGFGAVQACFAYESQLDKLAAALRLDPLEVRIRNALREGCVLPTGQVVDSAAPVAELLRRVRDLPLPAPLPASPDQREVPGGVAGSTRGEGVVRGVGYGVGIKNIGFSEGFDDYSTARVRLEVIAGEPAALVQTAAAEVGQGLVTVQGQIVRTELGVERVTVAPADTSVGSAGSSSASRQTYVTGGAVLAACRAVRSELLGLAAAHLGRPAAELRLTPAGVESTVDGLVAAVADVLGGSAIDRTVQWRHRPTEPLHPETGRGNAHVQYAFAAHRAVVDVDTELGLVRIVEMACAQDVGKAMNPDAVVGQIQGGTAQGIGLALLEEIIVRDGVVRNPSFTDYLIPTILDMPPTRVDILELGDPHAPYGLRGVGEPPTISSTPAVVAAVRAATGLPLNRVPIRPEHLISGLGEGP